MVFKKVLLNAIFQALLVCLACQTFNASAFVDQRQSLSFHHRIGKLVLEARKQKHGKSKSQHKKHPWDGDGGGGSATNLPLGTIAGVDEDHRHEQFFYTDTSRRRLYKIVLQYSHPLLICNPSLAVEAEKDAGTSGRPYLFLDRDIRFKFLSGYREFSLTEPFLVPKSYPYDVIFIDPPFANVTPLQLVRCLKTMAPNSERSSVPVYIGYNSAREEELLKAFDQWEGPKLERKWRLEYQTVLDDMQEKIWLYGPKGAFPF